MTQPPVAVDDLLSRPIVLVVALAVVSLLPFIFMTVTAFVKISTVLQITRGAIGAQSVPSSTVIMALAGALTLLAMAPVGQQIAKNGLPILTGASPRDTTAFVREGMHAAWEPMREFLKKNSSDAERVRFAEVARSARSHGPADSAGVADDDVTVLIPAFMVTQLTQAFAIGFLIYLPFLVIDLVVANVLLALGMQMMTPTQVSLPFKLLLFVAIDGWGLLSRALVAGYS